MVKTIYTRSLEVLISAATELKSFLETINPNDEKDVDQFNYMNKVLPEILGFVFDQSEVESIKVQGNFLAMCYKERNGSSPESIMETMEQVVEEYYETIPEPEACKEPETTYILMLDWARDDDSGNDVLGVYSTEKDARAGFERYRKLEMEVADNRGYTISTDTDYEFEAFIPGFYKEDHANLFLKIVKTGEEAA